jgi:fatty acid desaturase
MAETTGRESGKNRVSPARKYIRLQITGMAFCLATPVMGILAGMYGFWNWAPQIAIGMVGAGVIIFIIGHDGRQKLTEREKEIKQ